MQQTGLVAVAFFLPLFPLGMVFNAGFQRLRSAWLRALVLLLWPLFGIGLLGTLDTQIPSWISAWALFSAALYGFRAVVVRDLGIWIGFLATSAWSLLWIFQSTVDAPVLLIFHALAFSLPLVLLCLIGAELERRYGSSYAGIVRGVAQGHPKLSVMLALCMLAAIGSPLFPSFFSMISVILSSVTALPLVAFGVAGVWLLWSWSAIRLLQEFLVGAEPGRGSGDIGPGLVWFFVLSLSAMVIAGLALSEKVI